MSTAIPLELLQTLAQEPGFPGAPLSIDDLAGYWLQDPLGDEPTWAQSCVFVIGEVPDWTWEFITCALPRLSNPIEAVMLAAGPLEDLITDHTVLTGDRIVALAQQSARFRYLLSGVDLPEATDAAQIDTLERIARVRADAMAQGIMAGGPLPD